MTNKFGQTLAKIPVPATPLSPTRKENMFTNQYQYVPKMTNINMQNSVSPLNFSVESKTRLVGGCLPPLTESVHSFYKDTTFNSFRNIPNTTGSIEGCDKVLLDT